ncbi:acyltransferase family protein [Ferruginibacter albus]|uniref:acyltransferase family protein n=1 Tax=Ferruginibacter albus TaxID=2875540 RepID=UPI001CC35DF1|nr:acyltransferase [Ferruginibacter albus]UAY51323.1 acyltransferase [Ferruginibacter albus]
MTETSQQKVFFPNLDGLRFVCFFAVFAYHCNGTILLKLPDSRIKHFLNFLFQNGDVGVNIFFVLSGFLITYLLIKEKSFKQTISLKNFYIRRILRIWPLFYLVVLLGFVVFPYVKFRTFPSPAEVADLKSYLIFACNFDFIRLRSLASNALPDAAFLAALWSVAVEEQFYLVWPIVLKFSSPKKYAWLFIGIAFFTLIFRSFFTGATSHDVAVLNFHTFSVIGDMATGGLMAYFCSKDSKVLKYITNMQRWKIVVVYILAISILLFKNEIFSTAILLVFERLILAAFFAFIIAEQNFANNSFYKFSKFKIVSKLGVYTYGLYCLHFIAVQIAVQVIERKNIAVNSVFFALLICTIVLVVSIIISLLSYHLYEKHFLKLKDKFAFIVKK